MAQIWFLCSLQVNLSRMESSPKGQWNTQKNYPWKKSHEELYQILIPNTVTSIYVHCTGPDLPQSLGERNRAGACGLAWNVCGELLDSPLKAGKRGWSLINWWSIRYHSLSLRSVDHEFGALTTKLNNAASQSTEPNSNLVRTSHVGRAGFGTKPQALRHFSRSGGTSSSTLPRLVVIRSRNI